MQAKVNRCELDWIQFTQIWPYMLHFPLPYKKRGAVRNVLFLKHGEGGRERGLTPINYAFCQFFVINTLPVSITAAEEGVGEEKKK